MIVPERESPSRSSKRLVKACLCRNPGDWRWSSAWQAPETGTGTANLVNLANSSKIIMKTQSPGPLLFKIRSIRMIRGAQSSYSLVVKPLDRQVLKISFPSVGTLDEITLF